LPQPVSIDNFDFGHEVGDRIHGFDFFHDSIIAYVMSYVL
jgi:hypothetical protein